MASKTVKLSRYVTPHFFDVIWQKARLFVTSQLHDVNPTPNVTLRKRYPGPEWCSYIRGYMKETPVDGNFLII